MNYRQYKKGEENKICEMYYKSFATSEGEKEGRLIKDLVKDFFELTPTKDIYVFVAEDEGIIVGSIILTRMETDNFEKIFLLSPVAVKTENQGKKIGQNLISHSLDYLRTNDVSIVVTYGDINLYSKVGFKIISEKIIKAPQILSYPKGWLAQSLNKKELKPIKTIVKCVKAIDNPVYW